MRRVLAALFAMAALASASATAQPWAEKLFRDKDAKDNPLVHDFGSVPRGSHLVHRFKITNIYAVPMQVVDIRVSCWCGSAKETQKTLKPRESAFIEVGMDTTRFTGPKTISIFVTVGPEYTSTAELRISANSRADVVFNPGQANFGVVPRGQATEKKELDVEYAGSLDWKITDVVASNLPVDVSIKDWYRKPGQVGYKISVCLKADAPAGAFKQAVYLKTNDPNSPLLPLLVEATIQAPLSVAPETVKFADVSLGQESTKRVLVKGIKPFRITAIEGQGEGITAEPQEGTGDRRLVTIKWQPAKAGEFTRKLLIKTDLDKDATATVTFEGNAISP